MARASWLPTALRNAGLTVHLQPGWDTRGANTFNPQGIIVHATAGKLDVATDIRVLLQGSATAPPPIAQLFLARNGEWHVIASGRCNHALTGWGGLLKGLGNTNLIGIEAANDNRGEPWPAAQYESYVRGVAAICRHVGWSTNRIAGHKEHQPPAAGRSSIKSDPTFDMGVFRTRVAALLSGRTESIPTVEGTKPMYMIQVAGDPSVYVSDGIRRRHIDWDTFVFYRDELRLVTKQVPTAEALDRRGGPVDKLSVAAEFTADQLAAVTAAAKAGAADGSGPGLDAIRAVVDEELDEQARAGADDDPASTA